MMRTKPSSAMQKTYDECYLICSTAIYFESQNNEAEALRSWRNALDQIYYHNAYRVPANYKPKNETEKALQESLRQLELQCKERVDLLEALRQSREEAGKADESNPNQKPEGGDTTSPAVTIGMNSTKEDKEGGNWLGNGTVPPMDYTDLSRPPPLPKRPSVSPRTNSSPGPAQSQNPPQEMESREPFSLAPLLPLLPTRASRSPSPEKRSMLLRTLRPHGKEGRSSKLAGSLRNRPPAAAKAATQAWGSLLAAPSGRMKASPRGESLPVSYDSETQDSLDGAGAAGSEAYAESAAATSLTQNKLRGHRNKSDPPSRFRKQHIRPSSREESQARQQSSASSTDLGSGASSTGYDLDSALKNFRKPAARGEAACNQARQNEGRSSAMRYDPHTRSFQTKSFSTDRTRAPARRISNKTTNKIAIPANTPSQGKEESHDHQSDPEAGSKLDQPSSISRSAGKFQPDSDSEPEEDSEATTEGVSEWDRLVERTLATLPRSIDIQASRQILNEIIIHGDEVHWSDIAGLDVAKAALKETVVYPFLRPDLFMGLREPARGMLLFGPPGTGKTMLARAVATESKSTFFAISASSLTSKFLGESEKLVRALFALARALAPSIIFVDEIDSLLSSRSEAGEHETTRRIKTEFLIQWSDLARAAAGREQSDKLKEKGDASRVLVLAATNLPWVIDEAARRRFVRRQYIPLPEAHVRKQQLETLLSHQKHTLSEKDLDELVELTNGFSGSDITALAKDAAMGPLRSLGEDLLHMDMEDIRPIELIDFKTSLYTIRPSVSKDGLKRFEDWAKEFGERGG